MRPARAMAHSTAATTTLHRSLKRDIRLPRARFVVSSQWHRSLSEEEIITRGAEAICRDRIPAATRAETLRS